MFCLSTDHFDRRSNSKTVVPTPTPVTHHQINSGLVHYFAIMMHEQTAEPCPPISEPIPIGRNANPISTFPAGREAQAAKCIRNIEETAVISPSANRDQRCRIAIQAADG